VLKVCKFDLEGDDGDDNDERAKPVVELPEDSKSFQKSIDCAIVPRRSTR